LVARTDANTCALSCKATTIKNCSLSAKKSLKRSGSCSSGYSGSCNYRCVDGSWEKSSNTCTPE
ncbi:MAG: hypothetical protein OXC37_04010, partial [Bdellovibrionaceae bacterium]|nr:hypothetical protein [Pseudobdellovibrionaceae bacterium]